MSKRIIFCADGTWDTPQSATNVYKLFKAVPISSGQAVYYDDGVGSDGTPIDKLAGGAIGDGLFQKIKDGYTKIAHVYDPGDDIFLFGFSRGAYTARSLAGMIALCGLPIANPDDDLVSDAFQTYRNRAQLPAFLASHNMFDAKLKMVGVWDTVGSLGIPAIVGGVDPVLYGFLDTNLHPDVLNAFQALAIDERRMEFPPTLWTPPSPAVAGQVIQQVWFTGVHCDVGGGYPETGLSDITFSWMVAQAATLGLQFDAGVLAQYPSPLDARNALGMLHDSWSILWAFPESRTIDNDSSLGDSVSVRCAADNSYRPSNLSLTSQGVPAGSYQSVVVVTAPPV
jgi:uncharacterized protein (DUF2235 family)